VKHLTDAPLYDRLLALRTNNRDGWIGKPGTSTQAYNEITEEIV